MQVGDHLRHRQLADQRAGRVVDPHAAGRGDPDIALGVALHAVGNAGLEFRLDAAGEQAPVAKGAVRIDVEHADQRPFGVVDIEQLFVGREAQAIGHLEQIALGQEFRLLALAPGHDPVDPLEAELARPLDAEHRHPAVPGVGEIDRPAGADADVVRAVQLAALEMRCQHLAPPVRALAHQGRRGMLADDQVELRVVGHAVALVGRPHDLAHPVGVPAPAHVARHVGEQEKVLARVPDRAFGELETGAELADRGILVDQVVELRTQGLVGHVTFLSSEPYAGNQSRCGRLSVIGPGTPASSRPTIRWWSTLAGLSWIGSR